MVSLSLKVAGGFWLIFLIMLTTFPVKIKFEKELGGN